jgi:signal transduction histidine kinase
MQMVGVLSLLRVDTSPYFDAEDAELLAEIGRRTALALDNVYLYEAERQARDAAELAADRTARLQRITAALAEGLSFDEVTEVIVDQGITALGAFAGSVALLDDHAERLEVVRARGYGDAWLNRWQIVNANAPVPMATVIQQRTPLWIESREAFTARYPHIGLHEIDSRSCAWAILPLKLADQVIGALGMSFAEARTFSTEEQNFMLALAQQCSQAFERARLYQAEHVARAEAETAVQIRDQVFRIISHDLRSPLTAIRGQAHLLSRRLSDVANESRERFQRGLDSIVWSTDRMSTQIQELLDVASLQANKPLSLNWGAIELVELVQRVVEAVQQTTDIHQISVHAPEESLPSIGDEMRLERVLTNLITNAVKYSPDGGKVHVTLAREVQPEGLAGVVLTVQDQGIGIPADELPLLFRPFYRARNVSIHIPGTGLGLASARQIIQQHQGELHVESEEGEGSTFIIHLPLEE